MEIQINETPNVSIIVPCFNEEKTIGLLLDAIAAQTYPLAKIEIVIADSLSTDSTKDRISQYSEEHSQPEVIVIDNLAQTIPAGVNLAAEKANGEILIRMDAHSEPNPDYVKVSVELLTKEIADNVGGVWEIEPGDDTCIAKAIAKAAAHPLGVGDAKYRISQQPQYVDTVPFGAFFKKKYFQLGSFDETLLANEDYEFNARLRKSGGQVWMDPRIKSKYYARKNLALLAKQYWRYGFWKVRMLSRYPTTIRLRQAIPPLFVISLIFFSLLSLFSPFTRIILGAEVGIYILSMAVLGFYSALSQKDTCYLLMPLAIITMHFSWGSGFLFSLLTSFEIKNK